MAEKLSDARAWLTDKWKHAPKEMRDKIDKEKFGNEREKRVSLRKLHGVTDHEYTRAGGTL